MDYIDPHKYVKEIASTLAQNMSKYQQASSDTYIAPYTSLVTSSMMGKTRLMKELTKYLPILYICLRRNNSTGYPPQTVGLFEWFKEPAYPNTPVDAADRRADTNYIIPTLRHSLLLLYTFQQLDELINKLFSVGIDLDVKTLAVQDELKKANLLSRKHFGWMWLYFSDHRTPYLDARTEFWQKVKNETDQTFENIRAGIHTPRTPPPLNAPSTSGNRALKHESAKPRTSNPATATPHPTKRARLEEKNATPRVEDWASDYLRNVYGTEVGMALDKLQKSLDLFTVTQPAHPGLKNPPLIICFDEASHLCNTSAVTGTITAAIDENAVIPPPELDSHDIDYSNFRAVRRALRYLRLTRVTSRPAVAGHFPQTKIPGVFGLFTDTNARLTNFGPRPVDDNSARQTRLPTPGRGQFDPIHVFTSIDAHARIAKEVAVSDPEKVGEIERLLKFGRAGWYSSYAKSKNSKLGLYGKDSVIEFAESKLLCLEEPQLLNLKFTPRNQLRHLAVLATRLALTVGPFTAEATRVVASHLAVLLSTDQDRHFLQTFYPSEPVLAEASAMITSEKGWVFALKSLVHLLQNGIVDAGYRGELLSKVLCLMAVDDSKKEPDPDNSRWIHSRPAKVRDFLDSWLTAPNKNHQTFSAALCDGRKDADANELKRFLDGHVFFTHFIRPCEVVSFETIVCAWNRGAALMPPENTYYSFDHVIPVMLAPEDGEPSPPPFGPLYENWNATVMKRVVSNVSFILINSRNYPAAANHNLAAYGCTPNEHNFQDIKDFLGKVKKRPSDETSKTVYLSIVQGFGPKQVQESYVNILSETDKDHPADITFRNYRRFRQIALVLKELGPETYKCLQDRAASPDPTEGSAATEGSPVPMILDKSDDAMKVDDSDDDMDDVQSDDAMVDVEESASKRVDVAVQGAVECPFLVEDEADELWDVTRAGTLPLLEKLRTSHLEYLHNVDDNHLTGVIEFLPLVYRQRGMGQKSRREWRTAATEFSKGDT